MLNYSIMRIVLLLVKITLVKLNRSGFTMPSISTRFYLYLLGKRYRRGVSFSFNLQKINFPVFAACLYFVSLLLTVEHALFKYFNHQKPHIKQGSSWIEHRESHEYVECQEQIHREQRLHLKALEL
jgi:hypothetical protein